MSAAHFDEIESYASLPLATPNSSKDGIDYFDTLLWWSHHKSDYPILYHIACDYLCIPAGSVAAERANSVAKEIFHNRESIHQDMFKAEILCKSWLKVVEKYGFRIPDDFVEAVDELIKSGKLELDELEKVDTVIAYFRFVEKK